MGPADSELPPPREMAGTLINAQPGALPITLDTVFRLAQDQNGKVVLARAKLEEAFAYQDLVSKKCLPDLYLGPAFYRHEGGIQDFNGNLIISSFGSLFAGMELRGQLDLRELVYKKVQAEQKVWESMGEVSRLNAEKLLEASSTYMDLMAALSSVLVAGDVEQKLDRLLKQARNWASVEAGAKVEEARVEAAMQGHRQAARQLRGNARAAAAKLAYLLSLDPTAELVPLDRQLVPFTLVDEAIPLPALLDEAMANGPGIREMEGMLNTIEEAQRKARGPGRFMPVMQLNVAEGGFGAGPGGSSNWANRFDMALQARWNITEWTTANEQRRLASSRSQQAQLGYQELRSRLAMGVQEGLSTSASRREEIKFGEAQIKHHEEVYELSRYRFNENVKGATPSEVLGAIRALAEARYKYLDAIREHNQAQLRLFVMTGRVEPAMADCGPGQPRIVIAEPEIAPPAPRAAQ
jgi:outer membrane protein TolC